MIDPENEVINRVTTLLLERFPGLDISSDWSRTPAEFPHLTIYAGDSHTLSTTWDSGNNAVEVYTFVVQAYSNKSKGGKRSECREILRVVDDFMRTINARRESRTNLPNIEDNTIYRMGATYIVATDGTYFYRR